MKIMKLIQIGHERGNNIEKIITLATPEFQVVLQKLRYVYYLKSKAGIRPYAIILCRICMSFPYITCTFSRINRNPVVNLSILDGI